MKRTLAISLVSLSLLAGCTRWNILKGPETKAPPGKLPPVAAVVAYLNDNSRRMQTVQSNELDMRCAVNSQEFGLRGNLIAQRPKNFLLGANVFNKREVDLGSNDEEFWYWIARAPDPYQFYCSYKDLAGGRVTRAPFPFQPDWIIDAMGMGNYGPAERYKVETEGDKLKLVEKAVSPQGRPVRKVIVMNTRRMLPPHPQVTAFLLLDDASGEEICSAHITETQLVSAPGGEPGILPRRIEFRWSMPNQKLKLKMTLDGVMVNRAVPAATFARRPLQGVPSYDLASGRVDRPASLQQVKGQR